MALNEAEEAAIGRDLLVCQRLAAALTRRLQVLHRRVNRDRSEAALSIYRLERDLSEQAQAIGEALEWRLDELTEMAAWIRDNTGGWDQDAEDADEMAHTNAAV